MSSKKISDLTPNMQKLYRKFATAMKEADLPFKITCTARTLKEQKALYAQGRETLEVTNSLREEAGLPSISSTENKNKVTWTLNSKHIVKDDNEKSRAFDIVLLSDDRVHWDLKVDVNKNQKPDYLEAAEIGESVGLKAGARFKTKDYPHFEEPEVIPEEPKTEEIIKSVVPEEIKEPTFEPVPINNNTTVGLKAFLKALLSAIFEGFKKQPQV